MKRKHLPAVKKYFHKSEEGGVLFFQQKELPQLFLDLLSEAFAQIPFVKKAYFACMESKDSIFHYDTIILVESERCVGEIIDSLAKILLRDNLDLLNSFHFLTTGSAEFTSHIEKIDPFYIKGKVKSRYIDFKDHRINWFLKKTLKISHAFRKVVKDISVCIFIMYKYSVHLIILMVILSVLSSLFPEQAKLVLSNILGDAK